MLLKPKNELKSFEKKGYKHLLVLFDNRSLKTKPIINLRVKLEVENDTPNNNHSVNRDHYDNNVLI